jgi:hypothetical protein
MSYFFKINVILVSIFMRTWRIKSWLDFIRWLLLLLKCWFYRLNLVLVIWATIAYYFHTVSKVVIIDFSLLLLFLLLDLFLSNLLVNKIKIKHIRLGLISIEAMKTISISISILIVNQFLFPASIRLGWLVQGNHLILKFLLWFFLIAISSSIFNFFLPLLFKFFAFFEIA